MKLGLKYIIYGEQRHEPFAVVNGGKWDVERFFAIDAGKSLDVAGLSETDCSSTPVFVRYVDDGMLVAVLKRNVAAEADTREVIAAFWIYVPCEMIIRPNEIIEAIEGAKRIIKSPVLSNGDNTQYADILPSIFSKDFNMSTDVSHPKAMVGDAVGLVLFTPEFTEERFFTFGYQDLFSNYGLLYICDASDNKSQLTPIDTSAFKKHVKVYPPKSLPKHVSLPGSYRILIDGKPLAVSGMTLVAGRHKITLGLSGYEPLEFETDIPETADRQPLNLSDVPSDARWFRKVSFAGVQLLNNGAPVPPDLISVISSSTYDADGNPKPEFTADDTDVYVPHDKLEGAKVELRVKGFEPVTLNVNFKESDPWKREITVTPRGRRVSMNYYGDEIAIHSYGPVTHRLVDKGFQYKDGKVAPIKNAWIPNAFWALLALLFLGVVIFFWFDFAIVHSDSIDREPAKVEETPKDSEKPAVAAETVSSANQVQQETPAALTSQPTVAATEKETKPAATVQSNVDDEIVAYLDKSTKWNRSKFKDNQFQSLWDDMNSFNMANLASNKYDVFNGSKKFKELKAIAADLNNKGFKPAEYSKTGKTYNERKDDYDITLTNYVKFLTDVRDGKKQKTAGSKK